MSNALATLNPAIKIFKNTVYAKRVLGLHDQGAYVV